MSIHFKKLKEGAQRNISTPRFCCCLVPQLCLTLLQPHGLYPTLHLCPCNSQAGLLMWVAISFYRRSSQPRNLTHISCTGRWTFTTETRGKPIPGLFQYYSQQARHGNNLNVHWFLTEYRKCSMYNTYFRKHEFLPSWKTYDIFIPLVWLVKNRKSSLNYLMKFCQLLGVNNLITVMPQWLSFDNF